MRKKEQIKKFNLSVVGILLLVIMGIGVAYAFFSYNRLSGNNEFIMGNVHLNFFEGNNIAIDGAFPENIESARTGHNKKIVEFKGGQYVLYDNELLFSIDGINDSNKDFYFDFYMTEGDPFGDKERLDPKYVRYDFVRVNSDNTETLLVSGAKIMSLDNNCFYSEIMNARDEIPNTLYKIRIWIDEFLSYGDFGAYTVEEYQNLFFSMKINVNGDFTKKGFAASMYSGEINEEIGNPLSEIVYEIDFDRVPVSNYMKYYSILTNSSNSGYGTMMPLASNNVVRKIGDGVLEVYELNSNGTYKLKIISTADIVFPSDCSDLFTKFKNVRRITFNGIDTSNVTDMSGMFSGLENLYRIDMSEFDTSNVTTMKNMFAYSGVFDVNLGSIDISSLTDSSYMFYNCFVLSKLYVDPTAEINFGAVTTCNDMVTGDTYLTGLLGKSDSFFGIYDGNCLDGTYLNSNINNQYYFTYNKNSSSSVSLPTDYTLYKANYMGNTSLMNNVKNVEFVCLDLSTIVKLYNSCTKKFMINDDIYAFIYSDTLYILSDKKIVTNDSARCLLSSSYFSSNSVQFDAGVLISSAPINNRVERMYLKNLDTSSSTDFACMFFNAYYLKYIDFDSLSFESAVSYYSMFGGCTSLEKVDYYLLNNENVNSFAGMFFSCRSLKNVDLHILDLSNATGNDAIKGFIAFCTDLDIFDHSSIDLSLIDTTRYSDISYFFAGLDFKGPLHIPDNFITTYNKTVVGLFANANYTDINLDNCDFSGVTSFERVLEGCPILNVTKEMLSFIPSSIKTFYYLFNFSLCQTIDLSGITASALSYETISFSFTFNYSNNLVSVKLPTISGDSSIALNNTFYGCTAIKSVDFTPFGSRVIDSLYSTFEGCKQLEHIEFADLMYYSISLYRTFYDCNVLEYIDLSNFSKNRSSNSNSRSLEQTFYNCYSLKYIDLRSFFGSSSFSYFYITLTSTFYNCSSLEMIVVPYFIFSDSLSISGTPFYNNVKLKGSTGFSLSSISNNYASSKYFRPDGLYADGEGGLLTVDWSYAIDYSNGSSLFNYISESPESFFGSFVGNHMPSYTSQGYWINNSQNNEFKIMYCGSDIINNASSYGYSLYKNNVYYKLTNDSLIFVTNKPLYFSGRSSNSSSFFTNVLSTYCNPSCVKKFVFDGISLKNQYLNYFFYSCSYLEEFHGFAGQTSGDVQLNNAFNGCSSLKEINLSGIRFTNMTTYSALFYGTNACKRYILDYMYTPRVSGSLFGGTFSTSSSGTVEVSMHGITVSGLNGSTFSMMSLSNNASFSRFDCRDWVILDSYSQSGTFYSAPTSIQNVLDVSFWKFKGLTSLSTIFSGCSYQTLRGINTWDVSNITSLYNCFCNSAFTTLDVSNWDVRNVTDIGNLAAGCTSLVSFNAPYWDLKKCTSASSAFTGCSSLGNVLIDNWNTSNITSLSGMFSSCSRLSYLDLDKWDTGKVTTINGMFNSCSILTTVYLNHWDLKSCNDFAGAFYCCSSLKNLGLDGNKMYWNTSSATSFGSTFYGNIVLSELDLSSFDTSNVTSFSGMLNGCTSLQKLNISNWVFNNTDNPLLSLSSLNHWEPNVLIARNLDFSNYHGTMIASGLDYDYVDFSGLKLPLTPITSASPLIVFSHLITMDMSGWQNWSSIGSNLNYLVYENSSYSTFSRPSEVRFLIDDDWNYLAHSSFNGAVAQLRGNLTVSYLDGDQLISDTCTGSVASYGNDFLDKTLFKASTGPNTGYFTPVSLKQYFWYE